MAPSAMPVIDPAQTSKDLDFIRDVKSDVDETIKKLSGRIQDVVQHVSQIHRPQEYIVILTEI